MTTIQFRAPYTDSELERLYPPLLKLQLVQVLMRHGERTPVSARFQSTGLIPYWPYCSSARRFRSAVLHDGGDLDQVQGPFTALEWKRRLEAFGPGDMPVVATGPRGQLDDICDMGSLTDRGRQTTYRLGQRFRELYVDRLKFLPSTITSTDFLYLRSTPIPRALESLQQTYSGLYPPSTRQTGEGSKIPVPTILTRTPADETLFPNDGNCRRLAELSRAFAQRTADRWNHSKEMDHLNKLYGKWMPDGSRVAVDSRPRLSGIMDTINSTLAHGPQTRLPSEFYDDRGRKIIEKIGVEEWFSGYRESREYRMLGVGSLLGDIVGRMIGSVERSTADGEYEIALQTQAVKAPVFVKFGLSGCHDTTLAGVLASLGAFEQDAWPPYTSHIAIELFRQADLPQVPTLKTAQTVPAKRALWGDLLSPSSPHGMPPPGIGRRPMTELTPMEKQKLDGYYVRLRYNDEPVIIPACKLPGNHFEGDNSFCTLAAFKTVVDKFTPDHWKKHCNINRGRPASPSGEPEWAGY